MVLALYVLFGVVFGAWGVTHHPVKMMNWKRKCAYFAFAAATWPLILIHEVL